MHPMTNSPGGRALARHIRVEQLRIVGGNSPALRLVSSRTLAERAARSDTRLARTAG